MPVTENNSQMQVMPDADYRKIKAVSQSMLKAVDQDPQLAYQAYVIGSTDFCKPSASLKFGSDLERYLWSDDFLIIPADVLNSDGHRKGKQWSDFRDANVGKRLVTEAEVADLETCRQAILAHEWADRFLFGTGNDPWQVVTWTDEETGLPCKLQLDRLVPSCIVDLKTAKSVSPKGFASASLTFGYHRQAAWYQDGVEAATGERMPFAFVVVKNSPSWHVEVYELDEDFVELGRAKNRETIRRVADMYASGGWQTATHGTIQTLAAPRWAKYDDEYQSEES